MTHEELNTRRMLTYHFSEAADHLKVLFERLGNNASIAQAARARELFEDVIRLANDYLLSSEEA